MKVAVIRFPGANCDQDALFALRDDVGVEAEYVWHEEESLAGFDAAFLPGGFSYGDYLRCGAIAARAPIMAEVKRFANEGRPVIGVCNGFQTLCESGILPGALLANERQKFVCRTVLLEPVDESPWTRMADRPLRIPVAHGEGRYTCEEQVLARMQKQRQIAFCYVSNNHENFNINGSIRNIAGITNERGNVLGLMPHPERASNRKLGSADGLSILNAIKEWSSCSIPGSAALQGTLA